MGKWTVHAQALSQFGLDSKSNRYSSAGGGRRSASTSEHSAHPEYHFSRYPSGQGILVDSLSGPCWSSAPQEVRSSLHTSAGSGLGGNELVLAICSMVGKCLAIVAAFRRRASGRLASRATSIRNPPPQTSALVLSLGVVILGYPSCRYGTTVPESRLMACDRLAPGLNASWVPGLSPFSNPGNSTDFILGNSPVRPGRRIPTDLAGFISFPLRAF